MSREAPTLDEQYGVGAEEAETLAAMQESVIDDVVAERGRQDGKWGGHRHDDQHSVRDFARFIRNYTGWAEQMADSGSLRKARRRLIQVAALAVACVEAIDRALAREDEHTAAGVTRGITDEDLREGEVPDE